MYSYNLTFIHSDTLCLFIGLLRPHMYRPIIWENEMIDSLALKDKREKLEIFHHQISALKWSGII